MDRDRLAMRFQSVSGRHQWRIGPLLVIGKEIYLIAGSKNSYMATLVERHSGYVMLAKVDNKESQTVVSTRIKPAQKLPKELYKSLTWDRGQELADHQRFSLATNIEVYFCDPRSPWQGGSNENTNRLLRP